MKTVNFADFHEPVDKYAAHSRSNFWVMAQHAHVHLVSLLALGQLVPDVLAFGPRDRRQWTCPRRHSLFSTRRCRRPTLAITHSLKQTFQKCQN